MPIVLWIPADWALILTVKSCGTTLLSTLPNITTFNMPDHPAFGFVTYGADGSPTYLPLRHISAKVNIIDASARVVLTQLYGNAGNKSRSAQYIFPIPASGAVCAFKMQTSGGKVVEGVVKERSTAKNEYDLAITNNKWAGLLYEATPDVFVISMGAIPSKDDVEVTIMYVHELSGGDLPGYDQVEFSLPTYIASRYGTPPAELTTGSSASNNATFDVTAEIQMTSEILSVSSPSHSIQVDTRNHGNPATAMYTSFVKLDPKAPISKLNSDFVLAVQASKLDRPRCVAERRPAEMTVAMSLTFVPRFRLERLPTQEYIFLIDRSGSMAGSRIECAKQALTLLVKTLPSRGTFFNIYSYGSSSSSLWSSSQPYTPSTSNAALNHVYAMGADLGGTEIRDALANAFKSRNPSIPTSVFLLTDGEVWDYDNIFSLVDREVAKAGGGASGKHLRIFTLGIGDAASTAICEGVARRGNGLCLMTAHSTDISQKCARLLLASTVPPLGSMGKINVDWGYIPGPSPLGNLGSRSKNSGNNKGKATPFWDEDYDPLAAATYRVTLPDPPKVQQAPTLIPDLYPANRFTVSVILSDTNVIPKTVTLRGSLPDGSEMALPPIAVHEVSNNEDHFPPLIYTLAANRLILELEDGNVASQGSFDTANQKMRDEVIQAAVIRFSETYQIASEFASFVAVDRAKGDSADDGLGSDYHTSDKDSADGPKDTDDDDSVTRIIDDRHHKDGLDSRTDSDALADTFNNDSEASNGVDDVLDHMLHNGLDEGFQANVADDADGNPGTLDKDEESDYYGSITSGTGSAVLETLDDTTQESHLESHVYTTLRTLCDTEEEQITTMHDEREVHLMEPGDVTLTTSESSPVAYQRYDEEVERTSFHVTKAVNPVELFVYEAVAANFNLSEVGVPSFEHCPAPNVIWAPSEGRPKKKPTATLPWTSGAPIVTAARLQHFDGSFNLDEACSLIGRQSSVLLKSAMPSQIRGQQDADKIWATVLAAAYMKTCLADDKDVWIGLWQKAAEYIKLSLGGSFSFAALVDEACKLL